MTPTSLRTATIHFEKRLLNPLLRLSADNQDEDDYLESAKEAAIDLQRALMKLTHAIERATF